MRDEGRRTYRRDTSYADAAILGQVDVVLVGQLGDLLGRDWGAKQGERQVRRHLAEEV